MRFPIQTLNSVLVPLDSSLLSERAIPWATALAKQTDARIALVSVMDLNRVAAYAGIGQPHELQVELEEEARDLARAYLDEMVRRLRREGIRATWEVRLGRPADEIIRAADTIAADLVVMSSHGRGGLRRWAFGSVTDDVLRRGNTPVMVVP
jgi:nucleotide-binding universal stress UspA family protein